MSKKFENRPEEINNTLKIDSKKDISDGVVLQQQKVVAGCVRLPIFECALRDVTHNRNIACDLNTNKGYPKKRPVKTFKVCV